MAEADKIEKDEKTPPAENAAAETAGAPAKLPLSLRFAIFVLMVMSAIFFPTTVLFCGCLIPSFVAALIDNHKQRTLWITVGCMNFAGTVPAWFTLWEMGHRIADAFYLLSQPKTLAMAYTGAAIGWVIYYNITPFVARLMILKSEKRLKDIEKRQKELTRKWGAEVTGG
ncbi:MAG: hypothetical protein ACAH80_06755 [Alphaproteobacteria bacterium]